MKKIKYSCCLLLLLATFLCGCGGNHPEQTKIEELSLLSFETQDEIDHTLAYTFFGKKSLNTDKAFVTEGEASLRAEVHGRYSDYIPAVSASGNYLALDYRQFASHKDGNFSRAESFLVDVYNDSDVDTWVDLYYTYLVGESQQVFFVGHELLRKDAWNACRFEVNLDRAINFGIDGIGEFRLQLREQEFGEEPLVLYFDNFRMREYSDYDYGNQTPPKPGADEICSFEGEYFENKIDNFRFTSRYVENPTYGINTDPRFVTHGEYSFRIERKPVVVRKEYWKRFAQFRLPGEYLAQVDFAGRNPEETKIAMDIYSDYEYLIDFTVSVIAGEKSIGTTVVLEPNTWTTISLDMDAQELEWENVILQFQLCEYFDATRATLYLDHIRFENE